MKLSREQGLDMLAQVAREEGPKAAFDLIREYRPMLSDQAVTAARKVVGMNCGGWAKNKNNGGWVNKMNNGGSVGMPMSQQIRQMVPPPVKMNNGGITGSAQNIIDTAKQAGQTLGQISDIVSQVDGFLGTGSTTTGNTPVSDTPGFTGIAPGFGHRVQQPIAATPLYPGGTKGFYDREPVDHTFRGTGNSNTGNIANDFGMPSHFGLDPADYMFRGAGSFNTGGSVPMFANTGEMINHPYEREGEQFDTVPAMLTPGEFVTDADSSHAIEQVAPGLMNDINTWEPGEGEEALKAKLGKHAGEEGTSLKSDAGEELTLKRKFSDGTEVTIKSPEGTETELKGLLGKVVKTVEKETDADVMNMNNGGPVHMNFGGLLDMLKKGVNPTAAAPAPVSNVGTPPPSFNPTISGTADANRALANQAANAQRQGAAINSGLQTLGKGADAQAGMAAGAGLRTTSTGGFGPDGYQKATFAQNAAGEPDFSGQAQALGQGMQEIGNAEARRAGDLANINRQQFQDLAAEAKANKEEDEKTNKMKEDEANRKQSYEGQIKYAQKALEELNNGAGELWNFMVQPSTRNWIAIKAGASATVSGQDAGVNWWDHFYANARNTYAADKPGAYEAWGRMNTAINELHTLARKKIAGQGQVTEREAEKVYATISDAEVPANVLAEQLRAVIQRADEELGTTSEIPSVTIPQVPDAESVLGPAK